MPFLLTYANKKCAKFKMSQSSEKRSSHPRFLFCFFVFCVFVFLLQHNTPQHPTPPHDTLDPRTMANVVNVRVKNFLTQTSERELTAASAVESAGALALDDKTRLVLREEQLSQSLTLTAKGEVVLDLGGNTLAGTLTVRGEDDAASVLIRGGTVRGKIVLGADDAPLRDVVCQNLCVLGSMTVRTAGKALFDALALSNSYTKALDVVAGDRVVAHAVAIKDVWLPETPSPQRVVSLQSSAPVEVRTLNVSNVTSFAAKMQVVVLEGSDVRAAQIEIREAYAPRGVVEGVVPTSAAPGGPVLADVRVDARSGGEAQQLMLSTPEGTMVTATSGEGVTRPVVAAPVRTHGDVPPVFRPSSPDGGGGEA